jgi:prephenate dehydrogenase
MAGGERMGVGAARSDLFHGALSVITPTDQSHEEAVRQTESLWKGVGAQLMHLTPELHDALVARSSHLPHLLAAALANFVLDPSHPKEQSQLCANGFRDTTRIASGSPEMWRDIALANRGNLSHALSEFLAEIQAFQRSLDRGDREAIETFFLHGKQRRDQWCGRTRSSEK